MCLYVVYASKFLKTKKKKRKLRKWYKGGECSFLCSPRPLTNWEFKFQCALVVYFCRNNVGAPSWSKPYCSNVIEVLNHIALSILNWSMKRNFYNIPIISKVREMYHCQLSNIVFLIKPQTSPVLEQASLTKSII